MTPAQKLAILDNLIKKTEIHKCEECDHTHEVETGILTLEEAQKLLNEESDEKVLE